MSDAATSDKADSSFPENFVVGVTRDPSEAEDAQHRLAAAGHLESGISVLSGDAALELLDADGAPEGSGAHIRRAIQRLRQRLRGRSSEASGYISAVQAGASLIAVEVQDEVQAAEAAALLRSAHARHVRYYGRWVIEDL
ncbi:MAG TPA: hypothetical protein VMF57_08545 [Solirubrobacteraceae bacterium]|nr:hypothetical protein [Solirubrobacteraceae bacterium]